MTALDPVPIELELTTRAWLRAQRLAARHPRHVQEASRRRRRAVVIRRVVDARRVAAERGGEPRA